MMRKWLSALLAVALLLGASAGALADDISEMPPVEDELLEGMAPTDIEIALGDVAEAAAEEDEGADAEAEALPEDVPDDEHITVEDLAVTEDLPDEWQNILLLGTDVRDTDNYGRSDSMIVLSVNLSTHEAKLTSFMRDIWVKIPGVKHENKLNAACYFGGPELTMKTLNHYFGLNLKYYAMVNLNCMADIIDLLGGLRLDVTEKERKALNKGLFDLSSRSGMEPLEQSGEQVLLNGNQAVAFARIRQIDSDYRRTERQRTVLTTIAKRLQSEDPITIISVVTNILQYVKTNLTMEQMMTLAYVGFQIDTDAIGQLRIPAEKTYKAGMYGDIWCIKMDFDRNKKIVRRFIYG